MNRSFFVCICIFWTFATFAQKTKARLEQEKKENLMKIAQAERILTETIGKKEVSLGRLQALNQQIRSRQSLIQSVSTEIKILNDEISDLDIVVNSLQVDLINLKKEYADLIYSSYKHNKGNRKLRFLLSAESFNQLFQRMKYLEQYTEVRRLQAEQIEKVTNELSDERSEVEMMRTEQQRLLSQQAKESNELVKSKRKQSELITQLGKKEYQLRQEVNQRKEAIKNLNTLIANIVDSEAEKSQSASTAIVASEIELSRMFESNKNRLGWPVSSGFISSRFGKQQHPVLKKITIINDGIGIQTEKNTKVKTVFEGIVSTIATVESMNNIVIVRHGNYFTVYGRLKSVNVKKNQRVRANDIIGEVFTNKDGISELEFQVWKKRTKLNPESWLALK